MADDKMIVMENLMRMTWADQELILEILKEYLKIYSNFALRSNLDNLVRISENRFTIIDEIFGKMDYQNASRYYF